MPGGFGRKRARERRPVRVDANGLRREVVGDAGLDDAALAACCGRLDDAIAALERQRPAALPMVPPARAELRRTVALATEVRGAFADLVVLAPGELGLALRGVLAALVPATAGADAPTADTLRVHVLDQLDPDRLGALLARLDLRRTLFDVVSGAGDALATAAQFLIVRDRLLRELGAVGHRQHVVVTTHGQEGPLRQIVNDEGFRDLVLPPDVDEAAAILTPAALFPIACAGADPAEILAGAAGLLERCRPAAGAAPTPLHLLAASLLTTPGVAPEVLTPAAALEGLGRWVRRRVDPRPTAGAVPRPDARRPALFLAAERVARDLEVPRAYQDLEGIGYLGGQTLAALAAHEHAAREMAYWKAGRPTLTMTLPEITPPAVGQLLALVTGAAALVRAAPPAGEGADEDARRFAYGLAGRPGFEAERADVQRLAARREARYVA